MTVIAFNVQRVINMAAAKQQELLIDGDSKSIPAIRIFEWARTQLDKTEDLYKRRKSEIIKTVAERLESKGFPVAKISSEISKQLYEYVNEAYVREVLPSKYKDSKQSNNAKSGVDFHAKLAKPTILPEAYEIERLHTYSKEYLISIVKYLDSVIAVNCQQANERMHQIVNE